jgi:hypothetical protein
MISSSYPGQQPEQMLADPPLDPCHEVRRKPQQRCRWLGFPLAVMRKFADDHGAALTTVVAYNAFFALFPLLLVVVTVLGFLLGRDSGFQQRLLGSAVAEFPIIGDQVRDNIHGLRGSGIGLVVGLAAFAWGARGLTQVAQMRWPRSGTSRAGSGPASGPGSFAGYCCWWSSRSTWPRPVC